MFPNPPLWALLRAATRRFAAAVGGNVAMIFALALPPIAIAAVGGIQLSYVVNVRATAQDVADSAALAGAQQLSLSPVGAAARAKSWALAQLGTRNSGSTFTVDSSLVDDHTLKVAVDAYTPSFFGDMLPRGGFKSHAEATAQQQALAPLCVLVDGTSSDYLKVTGLSRLSGSCLVHANGDIQVDMAASIAASRVETSGSANGILISPAALTGAPTVTDPFSALPIPAPSCGGAPSVTINNGESKTIAAGTHGKVTAGNNATVSLGPGEHYFCDLVSIGNGTAVTGTDVALIFDKQASFNPKVTTQVFLSGRESGALAGFVWINARNMTNAFTLQTDPIVKITGAIYSPNAKLILNGTKPAAQASDWTVVAAKALQTTGAANLQINTNYAGSTVQVPIGVGNKAAGGSPVRIVH